jgi:hypothetical protein
MVRRRVDLERVLLTKGEQVVGASVRSLAHLRIPAGSTFAARVNVGDSAVENEPSRVLCRSYVGCGSGLAASAKRV